MALFDLYRTGIGIYALVGPYGSGTSEEVLARRMHGDEAAWPIRGVYLWTVNNRGEAQRAASDDYRENGGSGGAVVREYTVEQAKESLT